MHLAIRPEQQRVFEDQRLRAYAAEVASALTPIVSSRRSATTKPVTAEFAFEQLKRARTHGLKRRDEGMAWTLCALVHGADFDQKMPQVRQIVADQNYDRSVLLTQLAITGLKKGDPAP